MKILAIGNSFSEDATRYLHDVAKKNGDSCKVVNLYIGGCPLRKHYINCLENKKAYELQINGINTGFYVSLKEALISDNWDVVTLQQVSNESPFFGTYEPYLTFVADYVRKYLPKVKILIHQTWAYEEGSDRLCKELEFEHYTDMLDEIKSSYKKAAELVNADGVIPSGELFDRMIKMGIKKIHRDTFHASFGLGRYALALLWYSILTGKEALNGISDFDEMVDEDEIKIAHLAVKELLDYND